MLQMMMAAVVATTVITRPFGEVTEVDASAIRARIPEKARICFDVLIAKVAEFMYDHREEYRDGNNPELALSADFGAGTLTFFFETPKFKTALVCSPDGTISRLKEAGQ